MDSNTPPPPPANSNNASDIKPDLSSTTTPLVDVSVPAPADVKMEIEEETLPAEILNASAEEVMARVRLLDNDVKVSLKHKSLLVLYSSERCTSWGEMTFRVGIYLLLA
jgi:hypothetical protein